ncbi:MAG TPA: type II toxin-antitoxin system prevent-host-death family antitoxin [Vicinamibacterales bacterium]|jgi:prevent-host-death family protein
MKRTASVANLKARLSEYLRLVKAGREIVVTERGVPVARLLPLDDVERKSSRRLRLARDGALRPGRGRLPKVLQTAPKGDRVGAGVVAALLAERGEPSR